MKTMHMVALAGAAVAALPLLAQAQVKLSGYTHFDAYRGDNGNAQTVAEQEFIARRVRINVNAKINEMISGVAGLQADDKSATGERDSALKDLAVDFKFHPWAQLRAGLFKYAFDIEGYESSTRRWFMNRAVAVNNVAGSLSSGSGDFRDKGVSLAGGSGAFGYGAGLFQGEGSDKRDTNGKLAAAANLWAKVGPVRLNAGYLASDNTPQGTSTTNKYSAATLGAAYAEGPFVARAEYYRGSVKTTSTKDKSGGYVMAGYSLTPALDLVARYQTFKDEKWGATANRFDSFDIGVKYHLVRNGKYGNANVVLNYMRRDADAGVTQKIFDERGANVVGADIGDVVMARLQLDF